MRSLAQCPDDGLPHRTPPGAHQRGWIRPSARRCHCGRGTAASGVCTGIFGKWGLGDAGTEGVPTKQRFDQFYGYFHQVHAHFYYPAFLWRNEEKHLLPENHSETRAKYSHDLIVEESLEFIRAHRDQPFFLYLPWTIPHFELLVPEDSRKLYEGKFPEPYPYVADHYASQPAPRTTLAAMITRLDRDVGRVLDLLEELGLDEKTIVFFTSDNGGYLLDRENYFLANGPLRGFKGNFYEGGIRVPLIVRWPGHVAAKATDHFKWAFWDVLPTLASLGGAEAPGGIDGISVSSRILGEAQQEPDRFLLLGGDSGSAWRRRAAAKRGPALRKMEGDPAASRSSSRAIRPGS